MASFYYYDQDPSGFCFLVQIRAFVIQTSLGLQNLNMKGKMKRILVVVVKWRHRANGLLEAYLSPILSSCKLKEIEYSKFHTLFRWKHPWRSQLEQWHSCHHKLLPMTIDAIVLTGCGWVNIGCWGGRKLRRHFEFISYLELVATTMSHLFKMAACRLTW